MSSSGISDGVKYGLIAGACGGALVLTIVVLVTCACRRKKRKNSDTYDTLSERSSLHSVDDSSPVVTLVREQSQTSTSSDSIKSPRASLKDFTRTIPMTGDTVENIRGLPTPTDFCLPPERVQPGSNGATKTHYQQFVGHIEPELYRNDMSVSSVSDDDDDLSAGKIWYTLLYDALAEELTVKVNKAKFLPGRDRQNTPRDPFVKVYLLPDEQTFFQTAHRKKTLSPKFNETFTFSVTPTGIRERTLRLSVYDIDKRSVRHCLGHVLVPFSTVDIVSGEEACGELASLSQPSELGEINFSLSYIPSAEKIKIVIMKARNLKKIDLSPDTGVYIKVQLICGRKMIKSKRTRALEGSCELEHNENMAFTVTSKQIDSCSIVATVMTTTQKKLGHYDQIYGSCTVGPFMFARGDQLAHWQEMLNNPRTTITKWHHLQC
ncbi:synaptotagmin-1-like isoform X2 [Lineus longissimus]|uniref:synaptotagmin-1-like isoform X2 n=1 Tax=Lineus longissimus TaxID=88925 RepID=UPI002B4F686E